MASVINLSVSVICFHDTFYCIGTDKEKVSKGIEDNTEMRNIDSSKNWNRGVRLCMKKTYASINSTKEKMMQENEDIFCFPVIEPTK